ncbi:serine hydrolase domain-containing protein [Spongiimicrobium sp. 3-5]|uniref:serine hydrolase domain-containing protein n=1 Tax=Spongiimicrobium sp. 3-5 TaxID=3332596 RepID=UPI0039817C8A
MKTNTRNLIVVAKLFLFLSVFVIPVLGCKEQNLKKNDKPKAQEVIEIGTPDAVGINAAILADMEKEIIANTYPNIHSVLISKSGKLVYEKYFKGVDEIWGDSLGMVQHSQERLHDVRSISKSIVSACVGLAIKQGKIEDVDQKVFDFFPEHSVYNVGLKSDLTLRHLLTMTSGLEWNEDVPYSDPENSEIRMTSSPDPMEYVLSRPMEIAPGKVWKYNGGTTQLLAAIIKKTTGLAVDEFAGNYLFGPLGIETFEWTTFPGTEMPAAASGLRLRSQDLLKFGILYAQNGQWEGEQLLPEAWITASMKSYVKFGRNNNVGYGYQFWILDASTIAENQNHPLVAAFGNGDQRNYWDRPNQLIVVTTAGNYNQWTIRKNSEALLKDYIYPSFLD